ncbi:MAG: carboxypeptidase-like regulatory domain-containing protein [Ignavibacteriaceae bacterium]
MKLKVNVLFTLLILTILLSKTIIGQSNFITGRVMDAATSEPLIGANILVNEIEKLGTATDLKGNFKIKVPLGTYSLKVSMVGYRPVVKTDVIVTSGREANITVKMSSAAVELNEVTVSTDYFDKSIQSNNLSTVVLNAEEVRRSPGSAQDFQRILQSMPGVATSTDQNNELLVRGGAPNENLTVFDNIQLSTGGFISKYGDKLSSVMIVNTREGRRNVNLNGDLNVSFAGAGAILEGGIGDNKGSWLISLRKSYLDLIVGAIGLTAVPNYYDGQFKVAYDLSNSQKLSWSGIYGNDKIDIKGEPDVTNYSMRNGRDSIGVNNIDVKQYQFATGISLKSLWSKKLYSLFTLSTSRYYYNTNVFNNYTERLYN